MQALEDLAIFQDLKEFDPIFAGTIPIEVDIEGSDIDILCEAKDFDRLQKRLRDCFENKKNFLITEKFQKQRSVLCRFEHEKFRVEIFAQQVPSTQQDAFIHMLIEARLLKIGGDGTAEAIKKLKMSGLKTEPAFAQHFGIDGDPYAELLKLAKLSNDELTKLLSKHR